MRRRPGTRPENENENETELDFTTTGAGVDFTHQGGDPVPLLPAPGSGHPPTILLRYEALLPTRWRQLTD
ncbi:hypothetical protein OG599_34725 (plasmid) [Streptomyces sp. NBC_01335]|uniref:hypothetical protein n=1 Tax=Streptomyces sp. NBC_01335 TaxID=2903828 RepID=UPI002E14162A|nr:hypothetical protein OG599_34725 [Streptomyces sp. NBC_01335]